MGNWDLEVVSNLVPGAVFFLNLSLTSFLKVFCYLAYREHTLIAAASPKALREMLEILKWNNL